VQFGGNAMLDGFPHSVSCEAGADSLPEASDATAILGRMIASLPDRSAGNHMAHCSFASGFVFPTLAIRVSGLRPDGDASEKEYQSEYASDSHGMSKAIGWPKRPKSTQWHASQ
jgi:hypothetical protein